MKLLHAMIRVKDIQASLDFYQKLMGLKLVKTMDLEDCRLYYLANAEGEVELELTHNFDTPINGYTQGNAFGHFAFEVPNMDEFTKRLHAFGVEYLWEPFEIQDGTLIAFFKDPDGNEIEVIQAV